jgi:pimeloyl-ACP methyl ester carboxylesterase
MTPHPNGAATTSHHFDDLNAVTDVALDLALVEKSLAYCPQGRLSSVCNATYLPEATHWVQHDEPERVSRALLTFLQSPV